MLVDQTHHLAVRNIAQCPTVGKRNFGLPIPAKLAASTRRLPLRRDPGDYLFDSQSAEVFAGAQTH